MPGRPSEAADPTTLGLFEPRIAGDDALMRLARLRFEQAGMGAEVHAGTAAALEWILQFRPAPPAPVIVHLPRDCHLAEAPTQSRILDLAGRFAGQVEGWVLHDRLEMASDPEPFRRAARELDARLKRIHPRPHLFLEYAAGLTPDAFAGFFGSLPGLECIGACVDVGHVGIWQARETFAARHPDEAFAALRSQPPRLRQLLADLETAVQTALPAVLDLIATLGALGHPLHFHLHDGHPLSSFSPFGVADHLGFLGEIPLASADGGKRSLPLMFGPGGLSRIVARAVEVQGGNHLSFTLEVHPTGERLPLGDAEALFGHWRDRTNAEQMNHWLAVLGQHHRLLQEALAAAPG
jgi:hypothetical protein